jgi:quinoprotein glucose dehydrogenase
MRIRTHVCVVVGIILLGIAFGAAQQGALGGSWPRVGGDQGVTRYAPLDQITKNNVAQLRIAWRRPTVDVSIASRLPNPAFGSLRASPVMVDGVLYSPNGLGLVEASHPGTGKTLWVQQPFADEPNQGLSGGVSRGVAFWRQGDEKRVLVVRGEYLIALDPTTGETISTFGDSGRVNLRAGLGPLATRYSWAGVPQVCRDVVIVGVSSTTPAGSDSPTRREAAPGNVQAFDVRTGKPRWQFRVIPRPGEVGNETWENDSWAYTGDANLWSLISVDEDQGFAYLPLTSPTNDMYGGHRLGDNLFSGTLVCVRCLTGERVWHYQITRHDLFDYDLPTAPILADLTVDGKAIKAVIQLTKQAFAFVFDRTTGIPVWPIEERPVPPSDVPGERAAKTQPVPTKPPAFDRQGSTVDNLIDFTPELRAEALELIKHYKTGPVFTPPSIRTETNRGTIQLPGSQGGADFQGAAFDPATHYLFVPSITAPFVADIQAGEPAKTNLSFMKGTRAWIGGPQGLPLFKPPYGRITAINMNTGEIVWQVPNGVGPRDHPAIRHLKLGRLGSPGRPSPLATRSLLFIGEGSDFVGGGRSAGMPPEITTNYGAPWFRAYDKATGDVVWEVELPAGVTGAPITYMFEGKQYIVVAISGRKHPGEFVAFSLP